MFFKSGGQVQSSWLAVRVQHQLLTYTAPAQWSMLLMMPTRPPHATVIAVVSANGCCTLALLPARPSECHLVSAPCGPWMGFEWQILSLHFSLSFSPSVLFLVLGRRKPNFCRSSSDGETGRETERGGDRGGRRKPGEGIFQGRTSQAGGEESRGREEDSGWLFFRASQGPVPWVPSLMEPLHSQNHDFPSVLPGWCQGLGAGTHCW